MVRLQKSAPIMVVVSIGYNGLQLCDVAKKTHTKL